MSLVFCHVKFAGIKKKIEHFEKLLYYYLENQKQTKIDILCWYLQESPIAVWACGLSVAGSLEISLQDVMSWRPSTVL